jgi:hypothetical protein
MNYGVNKTIEENPPLPALQPCYLYKRKTKEKQKEKQIKLSRVSLGTFALPATFIGLY